MRLKRLGVVSLVFVQALLPACGGKSSPTAPVGPPPTTLPPRSTVSISVTPNPIVATPSGNPQFPFHMEYHVRVSETSGLACNINRMVRTYRDRTSGIEFATGESNPADITRLAGTNFIAANGSLLVGPFSLTYRGGAGGRQLILTVSVEVIDANLNRITSSSGEVSVVSRRVGLPVE